MNDNNPEKPVPGPDERPETDGEGPGAPPRTALPFVDGERRRADRRRNDRQGKYDRRRNRCQHCAHFRENGADPDNGFCQFHALLMSPEAFACPHFEGVATP